jgi:hypothetical protein
LHFGLRDSCLIRLNAAGAPENARLPILPRTPPDFALHDPSLARTKSVHASASGGKRVEFVTVDKSLAMTHHLSILSQGGLPVA